MCVGESCIQPHADLIAEGWAGRDAAEGSKISNKSRACNSALLVALPVGKEKYAIAADRTAERETELPPLEEWIGICGIAIQRGIGGQVVVPEEIKCCPVEVVAARARDHIDGARERDSRREIEIHS